MSNTLVAKRYAQALFDESVRMGQTEAVDADMSVVDDSLTGSTELLKFFQSPIISREKKASVVKGLFEGRVSTRTLEFMQLLVSKRREDVFPEIVAAYRELRDEQLGVVSASARSAKSMSSEDEQQLRSAVERMTGKRVRLDVVIDPSLIGGVVVQVGDTVYDGSVRNQLATLRARFRQGSVAGINN